MSPKRLVLFDIDGTLLWGGPLWKEAFIDAVTHYFPKVVFPKITFGGKTDIQIAREMMFASGFSPTEVDEKMHQIVDLYVQKASESVKTRAHEVIVLPGVLKLIEAVAKHSDLFIGLLTGNVRQGAFAKLKCAGIDHFFKFGVFGDDHWDRYQLPQMAQVKIKDQHGHVFTGKEIVIIGDTIHDVNCGKSIGVRTIAVGTGRNIDLKELLSQEPDYFFKDLSATDEVLAAILDPI